MSNVLDVLHQRGFVAQATNEDDLRQRLQKPVTLYNGHDPTNGSLTVGNLTQFMMLNWFQRFGHRVIVLLGGGTALIGDPSGKIEARPILQEQRIRQNLEAIRRQVPKLLDVSGGQGLVLDNAEWLRSLNLVDFMRDIGSRFTVNDLLRLEAYRDRLAAGGLTFLEFSYALMQSYDYLHLYDTYDCVLQVGGMDQWGNSLGGMDLIRKMRGAEAFVLVTPLILTSAGVKMGKTEKGAVWLDPQRTSPYEYYQFWRNTDDADVERYLGLFTFLPMDEVRDLGSRHGADLNAAKDVLAFEATRIVHGDEEAEKARTASKALFAGAPESGEVPTIELSRERLDGGIGVLELFKEAGLVTSANEGRSLISQGGLAMEGEAVTDPRQAVTSETFREGALLLSRGRKRHKRVVLS